MADAAIPAEVAESTGGRCLQVVVAHLRSGVDGLSDDEIAAGYRTEPPGLSPARWREGLARFGRSLDGFAIGAYELPDPNLGVAVVALGDGRRWRLAVAAEPDGRGGARVRTTALAEVPPGVDVREATPADAPILREIERTAPMAAGDDRLSYDRGEDYFAGARLMGTSTTLVVEQEGRVVGLQSTAVNDIRTAGIARKATYLHRLRLLPEARRGGAAWYLNHRCWERSGWQQDTQYGFIGIENEAARAWYRGHHEWPLPALGLVIPTVSAVAGAGGRTATPDDADRIVSLINITHEREELFVPYTVDSLTGRLARAPEVYSWRNLRLSAHAVLGAWANAIEVVRETAEGRSVRSRALALDYGFEPGHEEEMAALVGAACAELAGEGCDELSLLTSAASPGHAALLPLAERVEPYVVFCMSEPGPEIAANGVYVDQVYM